MLPSNPIAREGETVFLILLVLLVVCFILIGMTNIGLVDRGHAQWGREIAIAFLCFIIGSLVTFVYSSAQATVRFGGEHLVLLIVALFALGYYWLEDYL